MAADPDFLLRSLGRYSKWQMIQFFLTGLGLGIPWLFQMLNYVFIAAIPEHFGCSLSQNQSREEWIPNRNDHKKLANPSSDYYWQWDLCSKYSSPFQNVSKVNNSLQIVFPDTEDCNGDYWYDPEYGTTLVTEWNLGCEKRYLIGLTQSLFAVGLFAGALILGPLSDALGRKPLFLLSNWMLCFVGIITAFSPNIAVFSVFRFFAGFLHPGVTVPGTVLVVEIFPSEQRTFAGILCELFWAFAWVILTFLAYLIRDWRILQIVISVIPLYTIIYYWILSESISWLVTNEKFDEAKKVLTSAAKVNKIVFPEGTLDFENNTLLKDTKNVDIQGENSNDIHFTATVEPISKKNTRKETLRRIRMVLPCGEQRHEKANVTLKELFSHSLTCRYALIMFYLYFANSLIYYGLSLSTGSLAGDRFVNFLVSGLVEIPAMIGCYFILRKFGRRKPVMIFHIVCGIALTLVGIMPLTAHVAVVTLAMIGKLGIAASYCAIILYAPEIFPTNLRNQGVGLVTIAARVGTILSPHYYLISNIATWLPMVLSGFLSFLAAIGCFFLPETNNRPLAETIEDIESWSLKKPKNDKIEKDQRF